MKKLLALCLLVFVGVFGYRIADSLSPDAVGMAIGVLLGILAGIPVSLLVMAAARRRQAEDGPAFSRPPLGSHAYPPAPPAPPPVIILTGGQPQALGGHPPLFQAPPLVNPPATQQGRFVNLEDQQGW